MSKRSEPNAVCVICRRRFCDDSLPGALSGASLPFAPGCSSVRKNMNNERRQRAETAAWLASIAS